MDKDEDKSETAAETPRSYSQEEWNSDTKKARLAGERDGAKRGRTEMLKALGVADETELVSLLEAARTAKAAEPTPEQAELGKVKQKFEAELAKRQAELDALRATAERAQIVAEASKYLDDVFDRDLVLARYGVAPDPELKLAVVDGQVSVVNREGETVETNLEKFLRSEKSKLPWLVKGRGGGTGAQTAPSNGGAKPSVAPQSLADAFRRAFVEK